MNIEHKKLHNAAWEVVIAARTQGRDNSKELNNAISALESIVEAQEKTKVIFRKFKEGDIIAFFPEMPGTNNPNTCANYQHIGQHGHGEANCGATVKATRKEYLPLYNELTSIGYRLQPVNKFAAAHRQARIAELKAQEARAYARTKESA